MDFNAALAVLQQHGARPYAGTPPDAVANDTSTTGSGAAPPLHCSECVAEEGPDTASNGSAPTSSLAEIGIAALVRRFLGRQEERVAVYRSFEEGFKLFLEVAEATGYEALVRTTTATFAQISAGVNELEAELKRRGAVPLATAVRRVQLLEREKLELTARLQILRHGIAVDELHTEGVGVVDGVDSAAAARTAPLRAEEAREVEARLTVLRGELNEVLDEVRCELADVLEEEEEGVEVS